MADKRSRGGQTSAARGGRHHNLGVGKSSRAGARGAGWHMCKRHTSCCSGTVWHQSTSSAPTGGGLFGEVAFSGVVQAVMDEVTNQLHAPQRPAASAIVRSGGAGRGREPCRASCFQRCSSAGHTTADLSSGGCRLLLRRLQAGRLEAQAAAAAVGGSGCPGGGTLSRCRCTRAPASSGCMGRSGRLPASSRRGTDATCGLRFTLALA